MRSETLPPAFEELEPIASKWAWPSEQARDEVRWAASSEDFEALYEAVMPRLDDMLAVLGESRSAELGEPERRLYYLACAFAEASPHHELYKGSASVPFSFDARRFVPAHGDVDSASGALTID